MGLDLSRDGVWYHCWMLACHAQVLPGTEGDGNIHKVGVFATFASQLYHLCKSEEHTVAQFLPS